MLYFHTYLQQVKGSQKVSKTWMHCDCYLFFVINGNDEDTWEREREQRQLPSPIKRKQQIINCLDIAPIYCFLKSIM